jgi:hypothetical protein
MLRDGVCLVTTIAVTASCGGSNVGGALAKPPAVPTDRNTTCRVIKSQAEPLIVEWPETARGKLETLRKKGLVAVRYEGCDLEVLPRCSVKVDGSYKYSAFERKQSKVTIRTEDELYANLPVGAIALEGKLKAMGQLSIDMTLVGRYESPVQKVRREQLEGECDYATHVITDLTVGAFKFEAGADGEVGGGASLAGTNIGSKGSSQAKRELLAKDGDPSSCQKSSRDDVEYPPVGCGAIIQIEVASLSEESFVCSEGQRWTGTRCTDAPPAPRCLAGQHLANGKCVDDAVIAVRGSGSLDGSLRGSGAVRGDGAVGVKGIEKPNITMSPWSLALGISGAALMAGGGGLGIDAYVRSGQVANGSTGDCDPARKSCNANGINERQTLTTLGLVGTIGMGVGLAAGLAWVFLPKNLGASIKVNTSVKVGEAGVTVSGEF